MSETGNDCGHLICNNVSEIGHIEEILANILPRLPAKAAVVCKSVSKLWLGLISEPHFPELQLSFSRKNPKYIICPYSDSSDIVTHLYLMEGDGTIDREIPTPGFGNIFSPDIICFLNGLICCVNQDEREDMDIHIFNPTTQEIILLPKGSPSIDTPSVGLVFDPENNKYKLFRFFRDSYELEYGKYKCEVYSSDTATWTAISELKKGPKPNPNCPYYPSYVCVGGRMYWMVSSEVEFGIPDHILSVDMNENFLRIEFPSAMHEWTFLFELKGCLSLLRVDYPVYNPEAIDDIGPSMEIWDLINPEQSVWNLRGTLEIELELEIHYFNSVAAIKEEILFIIRFVDGSHCYCILNLQDYTWVVHYLDDEFDDCSPVAFPFVESLLPCHG